MTQLLRPTSSCRARCIGVGVHTQSASSAGRNLDLNVVIDRLLDDEDDIIGVTNCLCLMLLVLMLLSQLQLNKFVAPL